MKIQRVAIANRGEVAVRIIRACEELGLESVLLHSDADQKSRAYRLATKTICIGSAPSAESYLNIERVVQGALAGQAQAIHPGFGFLSENSDFVKAVVKAGLVFVGPDALPMKILGDKVECKKLALSLGIPLVPGDAGASQQPSVLAKKAAELGFPVVVKASAGGGGRGMKVIRNQDEATDQIESAQREAAGAFGNSHVFLEKYLDRAKHIEFQVFVDASGNGRHLNERECSVQRRHQKIIEEALSPSLNEEMRLEMGSAAVKLVNKARYKGAATVEFLLQDGKYYLLEVNTRLQVEHPVTEMVCGIDLVKAQLLTAMGEPVFKDKNSGTPVGHSIECRIYAEDPFQGGIPSTGRLGTIHWPEGPGRRFEYGFEPGDEVTSFYDPMIAKVIVWDETRLRSIQKMKKVLSESVVFGVKTNIPLLQEILSHPEFVDGTMTTHFFGKYFSEALPEPKISEEQQKEYLNYLGSINPGSGRDVFFDPFAQNWRL